VRVRLPFTLAPLEGEPFEVWLHAYAARMSHTPQRLAAVLGLPGRPRYGQRTAPEPEQLAAISTTAGLPHAAVAAMFASGPGPSPDLLRAWMPQPATRFCPACLAQQPGQIPAAWRLPVTFFCLRHDQVLASRCPHCGTSPAAQPSWTAVVTAASSGKPAALCGGSDGCGGPLHTAIPPGCADVPSCRQAQQGISQLLARVRDPDTSPGGRRSALDRLTDIALIARHLAVAPDPWPAPVVSAGMLNAATLTTAFSMLAGQPDELLGSPLAAIVTRIPRGGAPRAVPQEWNKASPALRAQIAHARDPWLTPAERLRHATALTTPRPAAPRQPGSPDPAISRAARLPDQIWADWAIRITSAPSAGHHKFRSCALAALLIPHSQLNTGKVISLAGQPSRAAAGYQLSKLTIPGPASGTIALRILTELALAADIHDIPVSYQHRRQLAASTPLIDDAAWTQIAQQAGMHPGSGHRTGYASRYLYELLTGCSLYTAPPAHQLPRTAVRGYNDFVTGITTDLAAALHGHARGILRTWGMNHEPLHWQPPANWTTVTTWPGADPAQTDPAPVHHALLHQHMPPARVAASLEISIYHLRQVLRHHPLPRPLPRRS
jgi:hypothetical protein